MSTPTTTIELLAPDCDAAEVCCASDRDGWNTDSRVVRLRRRSPGFYRGQAPWAGQRVHYKYHLGSWDSEEVDEWGNRRPNRSYDGEGAIYDVAPGFLHEGRNYDPRLLPRIETLPANLPLPAAFATRRIAALLPHDYDGPARRRYPVLYLQDGQNLFDEFAPYGNWELDKRMAWLAERGRGGVIVVAIDHAEEKRIAEYAPPHETKLARGQADAYGAFVVAHLKPLIDRTYRTLPARADTAIGGSSLGALAALQVAMAHPDVFAKAMLLSPSTWVDPDLVEEWPVHNSGHTDVFVYGGMRESKGSAATFAELYRRLRRLDEPRRRLFVHGHFEPQATHNESAWGAVFPRAFCTLFR